MVSKVAFFVMVVSLAATAQVLQPAQGGLGSSSIPASGQIAMGNGTVYAPQTVSQDIAITGLGVTTVNGLKGSALPSLTTGCLSWTGSSWAIAACSGGGGSMTWPSLPGVAVCTGTPCTAWTTPAVLPVTLSAASHNYLTSYTSTTGAFTQARPVCADLSDSASGCSTAAYVLPATVVQTNQANTYTTGLQDFSSATMKQPTTYTVGANTITNPSSAGTLALTSAIPSVPITAIQNNGVGVTPTAGAINLIPGTNISLTTSTNSVTVANTYALPTATSSILGGVKPDGTSIVNTSGAISVTPTSIGLGSVTNDAQTRAAVMPNTAPGSGQIPIGTGTAYAPQTMSQDCTITSGGVITCTKTNNVAFGSLATSAGTANTLLDNDMTARTITASAGSDAAGRSFTGPASVAINKTMHFFASGVISTAASSPGTLAVKLKWGSVAICQIAATSLNTSKTTAAWEFEGWVSFTQAAGASTSVQSQCTFTSLGLFAVNTLSSTNTGAVTSVVTNSAQTVGIFFNFSAATSPNGGTQLQNIWYFVN